MDVFASEPGIDPLIWLPERSSCRNDVGSGGSVMFGFDAGIEIGALTRGSGIPERETPTACIVGVAGIMRGWGAGTWAGCSAVPLGARPRGIGAGWDGILNSRSSDGSECRGFCVCMIEMSSLTAVDSVLAMAPLIATGGRIGYGPSRCKGKTEM